MKHQEFMKYLEDLSKDLQTNPLRTLEEEWK
jgi:hypothetical protein